MFLNEARGTIEYRDTLALNRIADTMPHVSELHATMMDSLRRDYQKQGYLAKNGHRQLTQIYLLWNRILQAANVDSEAVLKQSEELDEFTEWWSSRSRAESKKGQVEYVTPAEFDLLLAHNGQIPGRHEIDSY